MEIYLVKTSFKGAINGIHVRDFVAGDRVPMDDPALIRVALENRWIEPISKAVTRAPRSKGAV